MNAHSETVWILWNLGSTDGWKVLVGIMTEGTVMFNVRKAGKGDFNI